MDNILLVGIMHGIQQRMKDCSLIDPRLLSIFAEEILPLVTNESVFCIEGANNLRITAGDSNYIKAFSSAFGAEALSAGVKPELVFADHRASLAHKRNQQNIYDLQEVGSFCKRRFEVSTHVESAEELMEKLRSGKIEYRSTMPAPDKIKKASSRVLDICDRFVRDHIKLMPVEAGRHDRCFLIAGSAHCIDMHLKTGWPIKILNSWRIRPIQEVLMAYLETRVFPRLLRGY